MRVQLGLAFQQAIHCAVQDTESQATEVHCTTGIGTEEDNANRVTTGWILRPCEHGSR